jgi:hypothetical protein
MRQRAARPALLPILPRLTLPLQMFRHDKPTTTVLKICLCLSKPPGQGLVNLTESYELK